MNFCSVDWNEVIKILTPFIIAFGVYRVWHNQKGKEVIAITAKELIIDVLEEFASITLIAHKLQNDPDVFQEEVKRFNSLSIKAFREAAFLTSCLADQNLEDLSNNHNKQTGSMHKIIRQQLEPFTSDAVRDFSISPESYDEYANSIQNLINALKPYATYKKRFNFNS